MRPVHQGAVMRSCRVSLPAVSDPESSINHGTDSGTLSVLQNFVLYIQYSCGPMTPGSITQKQLCPIDSTNAK